MYIDTCVVCLVCGCPLVAAAVGHAERLVDEAELLEDNHAEQINNNDSNSSSCSSSSSKTYIVYYHYD